MITRLRDRTASVPQRRAWIRSASERIGSWAVICGAPWFRPPPVIGDLITIRYGIVSVADVKTLVDANGGTRDHGSVTESTAAPTSTVDHPYAAAIDRERERFDELLMLIGRLDAEQRERPGYFADDHWSVKDL